jgi:hypothetical protein
VALRFGAVVLLAGWMMATQLGARAEEPAAPAIAVIVGQKSFLTEISVDDLRELYLRRRRVWPNGRRAVPINLPADHPIREQFSRTVLGRTMRDMVPYWNARYFEGITPPTVLQSPAAIRGYLEAEPGAIAYVPVGEVDETCRTLLVLGR